MANVQHSALTGTDLHVNKLHVATHQTGGTDPIPLDTLAATTDNTNLDTSIAKHGLCPKLPNDSSKFLSGTGSWIVAGGAPVGAILIWPTGAAPTGWLECAGQSLARVGAYAALYGVIGMMYGYADVYSFYIPDLRGVFVRGFNNTKATGMYDPDAGSRTDRGDGVTGDYAGTKQTDDFKAHVHSGGLGFSSSVVDSGAVLQLPVNVSTGSAPASGGNESRPKNIQLMYIIKY